MLWGSYNGYRVGLVQTVADIASLRKLFSETSTIIGCDTETTGLCYLKDHIVGLCLAGGKSYSKNDYCGFYLPVRHAGYPANLPLSEVLDLAQWVISNRTTFWWNRSFDFSFLEKEGVQMPFVGGSHDIQVMAHEVYNEKYPALKDFAKRLFKFQTIEFSENNAKNNNFGCFAEDTEFLTPLGFRRYDAIRAGQKIAQYNPVTGGLEFVRPTAEYSYSVDSMLHLEGAYVDSLMTDNHRVYLPDTVMGVERPTFERLEAGCCCQAWSLYGHGGLSIKIGTAGTVGRPFRKAYTIISGVGESCSIFSSTLWVLCGLILGGCHALVQDKLYFGTADTAALSYITAVFDQLGYRYRVVSLSVEVELPRAVATWFRINFQRSGVSRIPLFLHSLSQRERRFFLRGFLWGMWGVPSESHLRGQQMLWVSLEKLSRDFTWLLSGLGIAHTVKAVGSAAYQYCFSDSETEELSGTSWSRAGSGRVVCFSVPSSLLLVRRHGRTFVSGNSTDPETTFVYAAADPLITTLCGLKIWNDYPQVHKIYATDNLCGEAVRRVTKEEIHLDYTFLRQELIRASQQTENTRMQIYQLVGYPFNIDSNREAADALSRFVTLTVRTKSGGFKVDKEVLASIDHPLAKLLLTYSAWGTYQKFVEKMASWEGTPVRFNYNTVVAITGRLSSSESKGNSYYKAYNATNCPKIEVKGYLHADPKLGFCLTEDADGCIMQDGAPVRAKTKAGLRKAFVPAPGGEEGDWVMLGCDYCVSPDTVVITRAGEQRVGDLVGSSVEVLTPYGWRLATNIHNTGLRDAVELELTTGEHLICSTTHRLWVNKHGIDCWVQAGLLDGTEYVYTIKDKVFPTICL